MSLCLHIKQEQEVRYDDYRILPVLVYDWAFACTYGSMATASGLYSS
jgi:hypothetical protein